MSGKKKSQELIGVYGGTFDPIHFGHINLAIEMLEKGGFSEIWFCPAQINPHKSSQQPTASVKHRLKMLKLALAGVQRCRILEAEIAREGPSYTIDTLRELIAKENRRKSPRKLCLIIGEDAVAGFPKWREAEEIVRLVPVFIGRRAQATAPLLKGSLAIRRALKRGLIETRIMDISSTEVRQRLADGLYCGHLVPAKVLDYIYQNQLYSIPK